MSVKSRSPSAETREVAPDVYRFGSERVNWYVVEADGRLTVVDAGFPAHWEQLPAGLADLGYGLADVEALLLTHGHADHVGFAERLRREGVPVWVHDADRTLVDSGGGTPPRDMLVNLWRPAVAAYFLSALRAGATSIPPVEVATSLDVGETLDVPGSPTVYHVPGHTPGECAFVLPDRDVVLVGDALVTVDMRTFEPSTPRLPMVAADHEQARASLDVLESLGEVTMLSGHGDPWTGDMADAVRTARATVP